VRCSSVLYSVVKKILYCFFKLFFRYTVIGAEHIPKSGGVIIAANHISLWDPPTLGTAAGRDVHFMAKEELFSIPVFKNLITGLHAFPVRRGAADRAAIRYAINLLKDGKILGAFPEGTRSQTGELGEPEQGIAMIAIKAGVPIVPAAIIGTNKVFRNGSLLPQFIVKFGKPMTIDTEKVDKESMEKISHQIMQEISYLLTKQ